MRRRKGSTKAISGQLSREALYLMWVKGKRPRCSAALVFVFVMLSACGGADPMLPANVSGNLSEVLSVRLNYHYEADVPAPSLENNSAASAAPNAAVQFHFDQNRPLEVLHRTISSPDGRRIAAVYTKTGDTALEYRLDMYSSEGLLLNKMTADAMAVHFPETIQWSPDSRAIAFVAMLRSESPQGTVEPPPSGPPSSADEAAAENQADAEISPSPTIMPTPEAPTGVLTFRTEQIYICDSDGAGLKPITQNEGLIYFYYAWSPDGAMLVALAATVREWEFLNARADAEGEKFVPFGRPRIVEKTGRERRLDDGLTNVPPIWSMDSTKVAAAYDTQIRIYDALGDNPTQAAVPLRNELLLSSRAYDIAQQANANIQPSEPADNSAPQQGESVLPDPATLVSFNPIVMLNWPEAGILYFQTAFIKRMKNDADSVTSFARWHRLILTPQPAAN